jgi:hypothetical protein
VQCMLGIDLMLPTRRIFTTVRFGLARPDMTLHVTEAYITCTCCLLILLHNIKCHLDLEIVLQRFALEM